MGALLGGPPPGSNPLPASPHPWRPLAARPPRGTPVRTPLLGWPHVNLRRAPGTHPPPPVTFTGWPQVGQAKAADHCTSPPDHRETAGQPCGGF